ncbi:hypothetical protein [Sphingobium sp.]|uniref:hypothetical protein n=1 Tax=Sphingobium sp. TaxID=1912891 RepID=UPI002B618C8E|nr:hypothetical protein [Sphingobium sp.]HUD94586.1 hypothetical protein [Sphingobium sp.]
MLVAQYIEPEAEARRVGDGKRTERTPRASVGQVKNEPARSDGFAGGSSSLLLEAARSAGTFQRSALGHLEHPEWSARVKADGQHLADVLLAMGFVASTGEAPTGEGRRNGR